IAALASAHRLPTIHPFRFFVAAGCLTSYGTDNLDLYRRAASYVARVLKGEKPADLPVQNPTKFELVINLKTAKAIGIDVPPTLRGRAEEVSEGCKARGSLKINLPRRSFLHLAAGAAGGVADRLGASLSIAAGAHHRRICPQWCHRHHGTLNRTMA